jgi:glucosamine--fructose-6-phosphate aminotransferase (isomerizing)
MCGIACFLSGADWGRKPDLDFYQRVERELRHALQDESLEAARAAVTTLAESFDELMSFGVHMHIVEDEAVAEIFRQTARHLKALAELCATTIEREGRSDEVERLLEQLSDYHWQIEHEVIAVGKAALALMPREQRLFDSRSRHFAAWAVELVLQSLDKLEVRGRDSAGVSIALTLHEGEDPREILGDSLLPELKRRQAVKNGGDGAVHIAHSGSGVVCRFLFKVAQLVGSLGDNGSALRDAVSEDGLFWKLAQHAAKLSIVAHTRWASNGIISVPNCHPVDGEIFCDEEPAGSRDVLYVLNGDVDNYAELRAEHVEGRGCVIDPAISTDAKILPVLFEQASQSEGGEDQSCGDCEERSRRVVGKAWGSLAVVMQHAERPDALWLAQKGSGQSFYVGRLRDGWTVASEAYGLAARCRGSYPMAVTALGGVSVTLSESDTAEPMARPVHDGERTPLAYEPIEIFSRDIYLGEHDYYIEKEIHEAPDSVRKTLAGKYVRDDGGVRFLVDGFGNGPALVERLADESRPIRRIFAVGMGTASIAAMGAAHLIRRALGGGVAVKSFKASELVGFLDEENLDDMLLVAISQSGTTTDTNRVVDLCRERGAWVHGIVNRRNSPLVGKADSYLYTSNGRDVEMAVASTKAFYSQITAAQVMALWLAAEMGAMDETALAGAVDELERLPGTIEEVLANERGIQAMAAAYGPPARNWAIVGNGANRIAAEEVRIKLSELCYKSIPCDITEDKKHIDLSTEPLTLVMASDLPPMVVSDTVKEATIFKAHNGQPLVFCAQDEDRFDTVAEQVVKLPRLGAGLGFVLATVAGHLWGIGAAKAIDAAAAPFRDLRAQVGLYLESPGSFDRDAFLAAGIEALSHIEQGRCNAALPAHMAAALGSYFAWLCREPEADDPYKARLPEALLLLNKTVEELTRPIDTIRHQAKTVTVGISRPQQGEHAE